MGRGGAWCGVVLRGVKLRGGGWVGVRGHLLSTFLVRLVAWGSNNPGHPPTEVCFRSPAVWNGSG